MKKILSLILAMLMIAGCAISFAACGTTDDVDDTFKIGVVCIGDENEGYTANFIAGFEAMKVALGLTDDQIIYKKNVAEAGSAAYDACVDLAEENCNVIFGNSFGFEQNMIQAAREYPNIEFLHATGTQASQVKLDNYHNAFASIYEARYLAGIVAGTKLQELIDAGKVAADKALVGYVGAFPYSEVISGYSAFYIGVKSACPTATMTVKYTTSWGDFALEKDAAAALINDGCVIVSQHADTAGAPTACEEAIAAGKEVYNVGYNISFNNVAPNASLVSSKIDWAPYLTYAIKTIMDGGKLDTDWCKGLAEGSATLTEYNTIVSDAAKAAVDAAAAKIKDGSFKVFDTANFTVGGETLTTRLADVDGDFVPEKEAIVDGVYMESYFRSAPYFDIIIDGITVPAQ